MEASCLELAIEDRRSCDIAGEQVVNPARLQ